MFSHEEVKEETLKYFDGDETATDVWINKYALRDEAGNLHEKNPDDMHRRFAKEFARIENKKFENPLTEDQLFNYFKGFNRIVLQGSPSFGVGNPYALVSLSNCYVVECPLDSYAGIMRTDMMMAQISKRRGGVGTDLSNIRPNKTPTKNASRTSTGIIPFARRYSNTIREIGQDGRRGALMLCLDVHHPEAVIVNEDAWENPLPITIAGDPQLGFRDIVTDNRYYDPNNMDFVSSKLNRGDITGANISLRASDEFMRAVRDKKKFEQRFPVDYHKTNTKPLISKQTCALKSWKKIIHNAWQSAEPGILFWDRIRSYNAVDCYADYGYETVATNPCLSENNTVCALGKGCIKLSELEQHDQILSSDGWVRVIRKWKTGTKPVYKYTTKGGNVFEGTENHRIICNGQKVFVDDASGIDDQNGINQPIVSKEFVSYQDVYDITVDGPSHTFYLNHLNCSNCAELPLCVNDSCRLLIQNLFGYVKNPFTSEAVFDFEVFFEESKIAQRLMDDLIDLELEAIDKIIAKINSDSEPDYLKRDELDLWSAIREKCFNGRRTGLGTTGMGDVLAAVGIKYGSDESIEFVEKVHRTQKYGALTSSMEMAKELGAFPVWNWDVEKDCEFYEKIRKEKDSPELLDLIKQYGRRNIGWLTQAPVGSLSCLTRTTSSGEPVYDITPYTRRRKINPSDTHARVDFIDQNGDKWQEYTVYHPKLKLWMEVTGKTDYKESPWFGCCANDIDWVNSVRMQAAAQRHIDHAISRTVNLPESATEEDIANVYMTAWEAGCKGITVYRDKCRTGVLVRKEDKTKPSVSNAPKRPTDLPCDVYKVTVKGAQYNVIIGLNNDEPYEVMVACGDHPELSKIKTGILRKKTRGHYQLLLGDEMIIENVTESCNPGEDALTRMTSAALRHGVPLKFLLEQLSKSKDSINSFAKAISRCLRRYVDQNETTGLQCPNCSFELKFTEGCISCSQCGYSKC